MANEPVGIRARDLVRDACAALTHDLAPGGDDIHAAVHAARKAIRRLRAVLALLQPSGLALRGIDAALQALGDGLSALRDAHVAVETAVRLSTQATGLDWTRLIDALQERRAQLLAMALEHDPGFAQRRRIVATVATRLDAQDWNAVTIADIRTALKRSRRRTAKAQQRATASADAADVHRWRRRVRRLWMQLDALERLGVDGDAAGAAGGQGSAARALHRISDRLGNRQDLQMLGQRVAEMPAAASLPALSAYLRKAAADA